MSIPLSSSRRTARRAPCQGLREVVSSKGLFCSLHADRASRYWRTAQAGGKVDRDNPTQAGRALARLGIASIAAYWPEARGRSERMFGTPRKRLPQEPGLAGITTMKEAHRFLRETFPPDHDRRFAIAPGEPSAARVPFAGNLDDILRVHDARAVAGDNTARHKNRSPRIPADRHRHHYVKARARAREYPDRTLAVLHGPRRLARDTAQGEPIDEPDKRAA